MDETGKSLECPFTWGLDEKLVSEWKGREMFVNSQNQPVKAVIYPVTLVFEYVLKNDLASAYEKMHEAVEHLKTIDQELLGKNKISALVLVHIVRATKYYYFKARGNPSEAQKALISVPELELTQLREKINVGTLNGCKGLSWSVFYNAAPDEFAVSYFRRAILNSPDCPLWHFLLARKLRAVRKDELSFRPTVEETKNFLKAYELSEKSQYIGAFVAQMYCEKRNLNKAKELCLEIFKSNPNNVGIKLRLSLTFIKIGDFEHAKECLDFVQNECSNNTMYLHYKAIYFEKQNNYKMATLYYQKSAETGNYKAEIKYGICRAKIQKSFDLVKHLASVMDKYGHEAHTQQLFHLHIAMQYYSNKKDLKNAVIFFKKAIEIDPSNAILKSFVNFTIDHKTYNIFDFVKNQLINDCTKTYQTTVPEEIKDEYEVLKNMIVPVNDDNKNLTRSLMNIKLQTVR